MDHYRRTRPPDPRRIPGGPEAHTNLDSFSAVLVFDQQVNSDTSHSRQTSEPNSLARRFEQTLKVEHVIAFSKVRLHDAPGPCVRECSLRRAFGVRTHQAGLRT